MVSLGLYHPKKWSYFTLLFFLGFWGPSCCRFPAVRDYLGEFFFRTYLEPRSREKIFLRPGHLAIQGGWSITAKTCRRLIQADTCVMRRPCSDCGYAGGQRLLSQPDRVFYAGPPSEVYHRLRECGKLKCARHVKTAQNCQATKVSRLMEECPQRKPHGLMRTGSTR